MFDNICIIGCGLIGSSILRAVKIKKLSKKTIVVDKSRDVLSYVKEKNYLMKLLMIQELLLRILIL